MKPNGPETDTAAPPTRTGPRASDPPPPIPDDLPGQLAWVCGRMIATEHAHERAEARAEAYHLDLAKQIASVQRDQKAIAAKVEHMATELGGAVARLDTVADIQGEDPDDSRGVPGSGMRGQLAEMVQLAKGTRRTLAVLAAIAGGGGIAEALRLLGG